MIHVGLFIDTYFPMVDGVIHVVHNYAKRLQGEDFDVTVFCPRTQDKKYKDEFNYHVERCKSVKIFFLDYCLPLPRLDKRFKKAIGESKLDIVHIHSPFGVGEMGVRYAHKHNIPVIATMHSQFEQDFYRATRSRGITKLMLRRVMRVFNKCDESYAVNSAVAEIFRKYGAKRLPKVLLNGTDFSPVENREEAIERVNERLGVPADMPVFVFVGRMTALKNIYFIAEALSHLKDKYFKMVFVGDGQDFSELKARVEKFGVSENVIFLGKLTDREEIKALYARAKLFLFPSLYDASSLVQIEAASQGTPTVFLEGAATSATVTDRVNGFIAKNSPEEYARLIEEILGDEELYNRVKEGAKRDLYKTWDDAVCNLEEVYREQIELKKAQSEKK